MGRIRANATDARYHNRYFKTIRNNFIYTVRKFTYNNYSRFGYAKHNYSMDKYKDTTIHMWITHTNPYITRCTNYNEYRHNLIYNISHYGGIKLYY